MTTVLETDSQDYDVLARAAGHIINVPGLICEIGVRRGGSLKIIIDSLLNNQDLNRNIIGIDCYGNVPYISSEGALVRYDYTNEMRNETFAALYSYVRNKPVNLIMKVMEDTEFFLRYSDGVPIYVDTKHIVNSYALVFFDGPHDLESTYNEMKFFMNRSPPGAIWVIDDIHVFDYQSVKSWLTNNGFRVLNEARVKASFMKV